MDIATIEPSEFDPNEVKQFAKDLVAINRDNVGQFQRFLAAPSVDMVEGNEKQLMEVINPLKKQSRKEFTRNEKQLGEVVQVLTDHATALVASNAGKISNIRSTLSKGIDNATPVILPVAPLAGQTMPRRTLPTSSVDQSVSANGGIPVSGGTATVDQTGLQATVVETPTEVARVSPQSNVLPSGAIEQVTWKWCGYGPPVTVGPTGGPQCPKGYYPAYSEVGDCVVCLPYAGGGGGGVIPPPPPPQPCAVTIAPKPTCPPGQHSELDLNTNTWICVDNKPPCDLTTVTCPVGYHAEFNPIANIVQCVPNQSPGIVPVPKPTVPDCQTLMDRLRINLNLSCAELPKELRDQLQKCGYLICKTTPSNELGTTDPLLSIWDALEPIEETLIEEQF